MIPASTVESVGGSPVLVWRCAHPWLAISSTVHGGGIGRRDWVLNATVESGYHHPDPAAHVAEMAAELQLTGSGSGMLTAVDVRHEVTAIDHGLTATVTTGVGMPVWAAEPEAVPESAPAPGTINVVCWSPLRLAESALVNAVATATEAKAQALAESGIPGTGTVTDAVVLLCPPHGPAQPYGGPRSLVGASLARAVHAAVLAGLRVDRSMHGPS